MGIMSLSEIMDRSIDVLRKYMKSIVLFSLVYGLIYTAGVVFLIFGGSIVIVLSTAILQSAVIPVILLSLIFIIIVVIIMASKVGVIKITSQVYSGEKVGLGEAMAASFKNLHKLLGIFLIELLSFIPVLIVLGGIVYFVSKSIDTAMLVNTAFGAREIILIILFILVILVFIFGVQMYYTWFSFALQAAVIEKRGIIASVKRSFGLIKRNFWRIFGITLLIGFTVYAIQSSLTSFMTGILSLLYLLVKFLNLPVDFLTFINMTYSLASFPISIISWLIITPVGAIMTTLLYYNQRFKKEGYDMVVKLRDMQKNEERKHSSELV